MGPMGATAVVLAIGGAIGALTLVGERHGAMLDSRATGYMVMAVGMALGFAVMHRALDEGR